MIDQQITLGLLGQTLEEHVGDTVAEYDIQHSTVGNNQQMADRGAYQGKQMEIYGAHPRVDEGSIGNRLD